MGGGQEVVSGQERWSAVRRWSVVRRDRDIVEAKAKSFKKAMKLKVLS